MFEKNQATLELEQQWFLSDGSTATAEECKLWTIPMIAGTPASDAKQTDVSSNVQLLSGKCGSVSVPLASADGWIKLNYGQHAVVRVLYTPEMLSRLAQAVQSNALPPKDRAALLQDCFALAKANKLSVVEVIRLLASYSSESEYIVWAALDNTISGLDKVLREDDAIYANFQKAIAKIVHAPFAACGWESSNDGHLDKMKRGILIRLKVSNLLVLCCIS